VVEGGRRRGFGPPGAALAATVRVHDPSFWRALLGGSRGLAHAYGAGAWDSDDLVVLVRIAAREMRRLDRWRRPLAPLRNLLSRVPRNTRTGARRHIAAHYDLGNELFRLFLDETMTYSCALFERPRVSLREAQEAKLERVCRKLELGPGDHVLEIGTGWGSFALHAAERFGCRVTTTTISREQHEAAWRRVREAGLEDRVSVLLQDYRDLRGRYDKLVSIEMIEAVGWQYFELFFRRCGQLLDPRGLMLLQAIVIDDRAYEVEKASRSFIKELIFPSGCLPSLEVIARCVGRATNLRLLDLEDITGHYPETLRRWRENFVRFTGRAGELGYDLRFRRLWELYLAYSEGGFLERRIGDVQALLAGPGYRGHAPRFERAGVFAGS
ncbi:MAG: class I SAM-dependent methyltransferase, partial [Thermoleophilaceae bacterium]